MIVGIIHLKFKVEITEETAPKEYCSWGEVELLTRLVAGKLKKSNKIYDVILGITNGGIIPARLMARELDINHIQFIPIKDKKIQNDKMPQLLKDEKYLII